MDPKGQAQQAKNVPSPSPKIGQSPGTLLNARAGNPTAPAAPDSTRPSQMGSAYDSTNGQGQDPMMPTPVIGIPPPNYDPRDRDLTKRFRFIVIASIVMDIIAVLVSVMVTSFYTSLAREEFSRNGTTVNTEAFIQQEEGPQYVNRARNLAVAGVYVAYTSAGICGVCFIVDLTAVLIARSLIRPLGRKAMLIWFISTGLLILFCVTQVIILLLVMLEDKHLFPRNVDMIAQREDWETEKTMLIANSYVTLGFATFLSCARADLLKPAFAIKKTLHSIAAGPPFIPPTPGMPASSSAQDPGTGTGTSNSQNAGKIQA